MEVRQETTRGLPIGTMTLTLDDLELSKFKDIKITSQIFEKMVTDTMCARCVCSLMNSHIGVRYLHDARM